MVTPSAKLAPGEEQTFVSAGEVFVLKERVSETLTLGVHCARSVGPCQLFSLTVKLRQRPGQVSMLVMRAVGMQAMQLLSNPEERAHLVITTNLNFRHWVGWVAAMLTDWRLQRDESEPMHVADGSGRC